MKSDSIFTQENNQAMTEMQAKVSQRMKLADRQEKTHMDKLCNEIGRNRNLTKEQLLAEVYAVKRLAETGNARVRRAAESGRQEMANRLASMKRKDCIAEMMGMLAQIHEWDQKRIHNALPLSEDTREKMKEVYRCIANQQEIDLTKEEIIDLTLTLTEQYSMILLAEGYEISCRDVDSQDFITCPADERRELAVAIAMNLKQTGKLSFDCSNLSDEDYAAMVCAMDESNYYCMQAAAGKLSLGDVFRAAGGLVLGVAVTSIGAVCFADGGFLCGCLGLVGMIAGMNSIAGTVSMVYKRIFPAGIGETRVGKAVVNTVHTALSLAERIIGRTVSLVAKVIDTLIGAVQKSVGVVMKTAKRTAVAVAESVIQRAQVVSQ